MWNSADTCIVTASQQRDLLLCLTRQKVPSRIETFFDGLTKLFHLLLYISAAPLEHRIKGSFFTWTCRQNQQKHRSAEHSNRPSASFICVWFTWSLLSVCVTYPLLCFKLRLKSHFPSREDKYWLDSSLIHCCWTVCLSWIKAQTDPSTPFFLLLHTEVFHLRLGVLLSVGWQPVPWTYTGPICGLIKTGLSAVGPESCSDCPPNISIYKSLWCSWPTNNNDNRVLLISLRVPLLRSAGLVCLELSEKARRDPSCLQFHLTITLNAHCRLLCFTPLRERKYIKGSRSCQMRNW